MPVWSTTVWGHFNIQHVYAWQSALYGGCCVFRPLADGKTRRAFEAHCCKELSLLHPSIINLLTTHLTLSCLSVLLILIVWPLSIYCFLPFTPLFTPSGPEPLFFFFTISVVLCPPLFVLLLPLCNRIITPNQLMHHFRLFRFLQSVVNIINTFWFQVGSTETHWWDAVSSGVSLLKVPPGVIVHKTLFYCSSAASVRHTYTHTHGDDSVCWPALLPQWKWIYPSGSRLFIVKSVFISCSQHNGY